MHSPRSILADWVVHRRMENPKVVPDGNITFLDRRHQYVLRLQDLQLDVSEEVSNRDHILDNISDAVGARTKEELSHTDAVNVECFLASHRVDPN